MPDYKIEYKDLTQQQIDQVWNFLQTSALRPVLTHLSETKIKDARLRHDKISKDDFEAHRNYIQGLKDQAGHIKNIKPPQKQ